MKVKPFIVLTIMIGKGGGDVALQSEGVEVQIGRF
jgi:hypothetical protein